MQFPQKWELSAALEGLDSLGGSWLSGMFAVARAATAESAGFGMVLAAK